jgi:hypothetical protein
MKYYIYICVILFLSMNDVFSQYSNGNLYIQALSLDIQELSNTKFDTIIAQKEDYFPEELPEIIGTYSIVYLSNNEIENYHGNKIGMRKVFPIMNIDDELLKIEIGYFCYSPVSKHWVRSGGCYYKFKFDCEKQHFVFYKREEYGI